MFANYSSAKGTPSWTVAYSCPKSGPMIATVEPRPALEGVIFRTKPELALEMSVDAVTDRVPFRWVGGDSIYGNSPTFVQGVRQLGKWYALDTVRCSCLDRKSPR